MFGFLYAPSASCSSVAKGFYQSLFCGLSCQLRDDFGSISRFLVNRDSTFLVLIGNAISKDSTPLQNRTCCNPLANCRPIACDSATLQYTSAVTMCALAAKLEDNKEDEYGIKKWGAKLGIRAISRAQDHATATLNSMCFPTKKIISVLHSQSSLEKSKPNFQQSAEPTAQAYGEIFHHQSIIHHSYTFSQPLRELGESLGRLIYWKDAIDDEKKDQKSGAFNPLHFHPKELLNTLVSQELSNLQTLCSNTPWLRHQDLIHSIASHSSYHHQGMTELGTFSKHTRQKKKRRSTHTSSCCDKCNCCDCVYFLPCLSCNNAAETSSEVSGGLADSSGDCCDMGGCDCNCDYCSCGS